MTRPDPEALLRQVQAEARAAHRGQLKIFLGYASGVGKSFRLFDEGRRRRERGEDVVVAAMQPEVGARSRGGGSGLEVIPTGNVGGVPVIDVPAVLAAPSAASASSTGWRTTTRPAAAIGNATKTSRSCSSRDLGAHVDQPRVHRRAAGIRPRA